MTNLKGFEKFLAREIKNAETSTEQGRQLKETLAIIQAIRNSSVKGIDYWRIGTHKQKDIVSPYFPNLIVQGLQFKNNKISFEIIPIYPNGKTDKLLFFLVAEKLNLFNFPRGLLIDTHNQKIKIQYSGQARYINNKRYQSKKDFDAAIYSLQKQNGFSRSTFFRHFKGLIKDFKLLSKNLNYKASEIYFYIPKKYLNKNIITKKPDVLTKTFKSVKKVLSNPVGSLQKPALVLFGLFLIYTIVKEKARK